MVELVLAPPKVPRRAVRILVVTVRFATARRRATAPWVAKGQTASRADRGGEVSVLDRRESGCRSVTQFTGTAVDAVEANRGSRPLVYIEEERCYPGAGSRTGEGSERLARLPSLAVAPHAPCAMSRTPPGRDCHRADMVPIRREEETSVVSHQTGRVESSR